MSEQKYGISRIYSRILPKKRELVFNFAVVFTMIMNWERLISDKRFGKEDRHEQRREMRTQFQRDYDRLIFSAPFRRLQNKTQVFPLPGSIFVHNRLTHSLEVSSVGRSLGNDSARELIRKHPETPHGVFDPFGAIVSAACLAHDLGNPPFGHSGERAIISYFKEGQGARLKDYTAPDGDRLTEAQWNDIIHFDGNANTFRLLTHQFAGRRKGGFVMTYSTLAAIVKYPYASSLAHKKAKFGFFESEKESYRRIADELGIPGKEVGPGRYSYVRHPLVYLVEAADDICYEIMDIEDAHKLRLLSDTHTIELLLSFFDTSTQDRITSEFTEVTDTNERIVYLRSCVINALEQACVSIFVDHEEDLLAGTFSGSLIDHLPGRMLDAYRQCEHIARRHIYECKDVVDIDLAGYRIIYTLLELMMDAMLSPEKAYSKLLISRVSEQYQLTAPRLYDRVMAVLDYISGMTDVYALDLYRKINGNSLPMV